MASGIYSNFKYNCFAGRQDLEADSPSDVIKVALMDTNHSFNAAHNVWGQVSANELAAAGNYTTGGNILTDQTITKAALTKFDGDDVLWPDASFTAYHAVIYNSTTGDLIASIDFGGAQSPAGALFTIQWNASGIMTLATV